MSKETSEENSIEMSYKEFNGEKHKEVKLKSGDVFELTSNIKTNSGNLKVTVTDENDSELYSIENPNEETVKDIKITKNGDYKIEVQGKHSGSFNVK